jgi:lysophospholipase L1-like esterase
VSPTRPRRALAALLGLFLALGAGEAAVRLAGLRVPERGQAGGMCTELLRPVEEPRGLLWELVPGAEGEAHYPPAAGRPGRTVRYRVGAQGFRGEPVSVRPAPGALRIAVLGDSFTFGTGLERDETLPAVLEERLSELFEDRDVEVMNCGVEGYNTVQEVVLLEERVARHEPHLALLCVYVNDAVTHTGSDNDVAEPASLALARRLGLTPAGQREGGLPARLVGAARDTSRLADLVMHRLELALVHAGTVERFRRQWAPDGAGWRAHRAALERATRVAEERGFALHVVSWPALTDVSLDYPLEELHARTAAVCAELGLPLHDLRAPLGTLATRALPVHPHDRHPSPEASRAAGLWLAHRLAPAVAWAP